MAAQLWTNAQAALIPGIGDCSPPDDDDDDRLTEEEAREIAAGELMATPACTIESLNNAIPSAEDKPVDFGALSWPEFDPALLTTPQLWAFVMAGDAKDIVRAVMALRERVEKLADMQDAIKTRADELLAADAPMTFEPDDPPEPLPW